MHLVWSHLLRYRCKRIAACCSRMSKNNRSSHESATYLVSNEAYISVQLTYWNRFRMTTYYKYKVGALEGWMQTMTLKCYVISLGMFVWRSYSWLTAMLTQTLHVPSKCRVGLRYVLIGISALFTDASTTNLRSSVDRSIRHRKKRSPQWSLSDAKLQQIFYNCFCCASPQLDRGCKWNNSRDINRCFHTRIEKSNTEL